MIINRDLMPIYTKQCRISESQDTTITGKIVQLRGKNREGGIG
jgi:hypothetical protein